MKIPASLEFNKILVRLSEKALSEQGKQAALKLEPTNEKDSALLQMEETEQAESLLVKRSDYPILAFNEIKGALKRLKAGAALAPKELLNIAKVLKAAKHAAPLSREEDTPHIANLASGLYFDERLINDIYASVISDNEISDRASSELNRIRRAIRHENEQIREKLNKLVKSQKDGKYLQDGIITQRQGRYVVPVKVEYKSEVPGIVHERSASGATLFIEPAGVVDANNRIRELEGEEAAEIARILSALSAAAASIREEIKADEEILVRLDILFAKASLAKEMNAHPVAFNDEGVIRINEGRHPLIDKEKVVPVSVKLDDGIRGLIITGPNTGGKTVTLKLIGLFGAMAQCGLFVPAQPIVSLPVFEGIFADIGDEQSIQQSLSTFSAHMKSIIFAVKHARNNSLVLLDELGAGTDPQEGSALAQAVLAYLYKKGCLLFATTHIGDLKSFAVKNEGFENACMEFDSATYTPTYKLIMGIAGKSNALKISRQLGLPKEIEAAAQSYMNSEAVEYDKLIERAQKERAKTAEKLKKADAALNEAQRERERAKRIYEKAAEKRKKILESANEKAIEIIDGARDTAEEAIAEAKKLPGKSESEMTAQTKKVRDTLKNKKNYIQSHNIIQKKKFNEPVNPENIKEGDAVKIISMNMPATVISPPDSKGMVELQAGIMKTKVHYGELTSAEETSQPSEREQYLSHMNISGRNNISLSLDLHGENVDNAEIKIDKYLDDAFLAGLNRVSIIHGRGTGALRKGVIAYLKTHPHVKSLRQGNYDEGGTGVTIVTLK